MRDLVVTVIIPTLNPDEKLVKVVEELIRGGTKDIIIVNDGSDSAHMGPIRKVEKFKECTVLTHEKNKGKGAALKTAFSYCVKNRKNISGVVTVDGDGQHAAKDVISCSRSMVRNRNKVILGCRDFSKDDIPARSKFGNNLTKSVFKKLCGMEITDTQTGLRAIPYIYLEKMLEVTGQRYEYETEMLLDMKKWNIEFIEEKIETVYIEENESSHFNPVKDSIKIYTMIFKYFLKSEKIKYIFGSLSASVIDISLFAIISFVFAWMSESPQIFIATVGARFVSSLYNFCYNKLVVFKKQEDTTKSMIKYYILCIAQMMVSYGLVYLLTMLFGAGEAGSVIIKMVVDTSLFVASFFIQKKWVFSKRKEKVHMVKAVKRGKI